MASSSYTSQALAIPDIIISIISHVISQQDQAHFASVNRATYELCTIPRVRFVKIESSEGILWSFLQYIRKWKVAGHCLSLTIEQSEATRATSIISFLIIKEMSDSVERQLQHLSYRLPMLLPSLNGGIRSSDQLEVKLEDLLDKVRLLDDIGDLYKAIWKKMSRENIDVNLIWIKIWQELPHINALEELDIDLPLGSWGAFCNGVYPNLKMLQLRLFSRGWNDVQTADVPSPSSPPFQGLERLKVSFREGVDPNPILQSTFPSLRAFELKTSDEENLPDEDLLSRLARFIERHPDIRAASLGKNYVRSAGQYLESAEHLRALHLEVPTSATVLSIPNALGNIPHIAHLRLSGAVTVVLMFLKRSPARPKLPHFRCVELECGNAKEFKDLMRPYSGHEITFRIAQLWDLFPNICEAAFSMTFGGLSLREVLPTLLERLQGSGTLRALRLRNLGAELDGGDFPVELVETTKAIPPNLQFIVWENETSTQTYELLADSESGKRRKVRRISHPREARTRGRWSLDWHEESVFDHIDEDYDKL
ncbi:hypothetical protein SCHPADRAFT_937683 [Schizopora paradoxa]|uniref:Uncharacterized protein n=1 Tax=Schizopora paradoxa TaxID=27342 RepID=A0A0H2SHU9_9AGAM|nr:hypothetical protein SCHPADRAFT_937683 [Schizopora paradoxa]